MAFFAWVFLGIFLWSLNWYVFSKSTPISIARDVSGIELNSSEREVSSIGGIATRAALSSIAASSFSAGNKGTAGLYAGAASGIKTSKIKGTYIAKISLKDGHQFTLKTDRQGFETLSYHA